MQSDAKRIRVVILEDDVDLRMLLRKMLERDGRFLVVGEAGDGEEGMDVLEMVAHDLLLMDLDMPDVDGFAVLRDLAAKGRRPATVVMISALDEAYYGQRAARLGADDWVAKSDSPSDLADRLARVHEASTAPPTA